MKKANKNIFLILGIVFFAVFAFFFNALAGCSDSDEECCGDACWGTRCDVGDWSCSGGTDPYTGTTIPSCTRFRYVYTCITSGCCATSVEYEGSCEGQIISQNTSCWGLCDLYVTRCIGGEMQTTHDTASCENQCCSDAIAGYGTCKSGSCASQCCFYFDCVESSCGAWTDIGCGLGGCSSDKMYQTRTCPFCSKCVQSQCVGSASCPSCILNGAACLQDSECCKGNCVLDYDGTGKICSPANQCQHNGGFYGIGAVSESNLCVDCKDPTARWVYNSSGRFIVKKKNSGNKMILDKNGQLLLSGYKQSWASPNGGDWLVKSAGVLKAWLDDVFGHLYLIGGSLAEQQIISPGTGSELLIKTKTPSTYVGKIDSSGNMFIKGQLGEGCSLP